MVAGLDSHLEPTTTTTHTHTYHITHACTHNLACRGSSRRLPAGGGRQRTTLSPTPATGCAPWGGAWRVQTCFSQALGPPIP